MGGREESGRARPLCPTKAAPPFFSHHPLLSHSIPPRRDTPTENKDGAAPAGTLKSFFKPAAAGAGPAQPPRAAMAMVAKAGAAKKAVVKPKPGAKAGVAGPGGASKRPAAGAASGGGSSKKGKTAASGEAGPGIGTDGDAAIAAAEAEAAQDVHLPAFYVLARATTVSAACLGAHAHDCYVPPMAGEDIKHVCGADAVLRGMHTRLKRLGLGSAEWARLDQAAARVLAKVTLATGAAGDAADYTIDLDGGLADLGTRHLDVVRAGVKWMLARLSMDGSIPAPTRASIVTSLGEASKKLDNAILARFRYAVALVVAGEDGPLKGATFHISMREAAILALHGSLKKSSVGQVRVHAAAQGLVRPEDVAIVGRSTGSVLSFALTQILDKVGAPGLAMIAKPAANVWCCSSVPATLLTVDKRPGGKRSSVPPVDQVQEAMELLSVEERQKAAGRDPPIFRKVDVWAKLKELEAVEERTNDSEPATWSSYDKSTAMDRLSSYLGIDAARKENRTMYRHSDLRDLGVRKGVPNADLQRQPWVCLVADWKDAVAEAAAKAKAGGSGA